MGEEGVGWYTLTGQLVGENSDSESPPQKWRTWAGVEGRFDLFCSMLLLLVQGEQNHFTMCRLRHASLRLANESRLYGKVFQQHIYTVPCFSSLVLFSSTWVRLDSCPTLGADVGATIFRYFQEAEKKSIFLKHILI